MAPVIHPTARELEPVVISSSVAVREHRVSTPVDVRESLELIQRCLSGDIQASKDFQHLFGDLIYGYPTRVFRMPPEAAGDFYVFALDGGRIYRRLRTFEGRAPLRAYLLGFVLDDLVLEWKRGEKEIDTVSMEAIGELPGPVTMGVHHDDREEEEFPLEELLAQVDVAKSVIMKLLHIEDYELSAAELRYVAETSGRDLSWVITEVNDLRSTVRERESTLKQLQDSVEGVHAWIQLYEKRLRRIGEDLQSLPPGSVATQKLQEERTELQRKVIKRREQHTRLIDRAQRRKVTAPYKSIAYILNTTVGNVGSMIARLRQEITTRAQQMRESTVRGEGRWN